MGFGAIASPTLQDAYAQRLRAQLVGTQPAFPSIPLRNVGPIGPVYGGPPARLSEYITRGYNPQAGQGVAEMLRRRNYLAGFLGRNPGVGVYGPPGRSPFAGRLLSINRGLGPYGPPGLTPERSPTPGSALRAFQGGGTLQPGQALRNIQMGLRPRQFFNMLPSQRGLLESTISALGLPPEDWNASYLQGLPPGVNPNFGLQPTF